MNVLKPLENTCRIENNKTVCPERVPPYLEEHGNVTTTEKIMGELIFTVYTHNYHLSIVVNFVLDLLIVAKH